VCERVLAALVHSRFLMLTSEGAYLRHGEAGRPDNARRTRRSVTIVHFTRPTKCAQNMRTAKC
jgi:hypothetical protein